MTVDIEVYLNTEQYSKDVLIESLEQFLSSDSYSFVGDKLTSSSLPSEVNFLRFEYKFNRDCVVNRKQYYFVPPLEAASPSEEFITGPVSIFLPCTLHHKTCFPQFLNSFLYLDGETSSTSSHNWMLPNEGFDGLWESVFLSNNVKQNLLRFAIIALKFGDSGVNPNIILCNRLIFLHGPPGTGKTTICKAIAQKLSIRLIEKYPVAQLIEINCHSLLSKWFSESGKLVTKLFENIRSYASNPEMLVVVLIDEVESLTSARQSAINSQEPSDAIRVVNAVLTQLDSLRLYPNVLILATSNLSDAIDPAFTDRADFVQLIGLPTEEQISDILKSIFSELEKAKIFPKDSLTNEETSSLSELCVGLSGRAIRKLPLVALALADEQSHSNFLRHYLVLAIKQMKRGADKSQ